MNKHSYLFAAGLVHQHGEAAGDPRAGPHDAADDATGGGRGGSGGHLKREVLAVSPGKVLVL